MDMADNYLKNYSSCGDNSIKKSFSSSSSFKSLSIRQPKIVLKKVLPPSTSIGSPYSSLSSPLPSSSFSCQSYLNTIKEEEAQSHPLSFLIHNIQMKLKKYNINLRLY